MRYYALAATVLLCAVQPLGAQLRSVPVFGVLAARPGWVVGLDYGSGLNDASGHARHWGGRAGLGTGRLQLTAGGGAWDAGSSTSPQLGGTGLLRIVGRGSGGLALHALAGAGYTRSGPADSSATYVTIPLGFAVAHSGLRTSRGALTPWLASVAELDQVSFSGIRATQTGLALSGGVAAMLSGRLGLHLALEASRMFERRVGGVTLQEGTRVTVGAGVHLVLSGAP